MSRVSYIVMGKRSGSALYGPSGQSPQGSPAKSYIEVPRKRPKCHLAAVFTLVARNGKQSQKTMERSTIFNR